MTAIRALPVAFAAAALLASACSDTATVDRRPAGSAAGRDFAAADARPRIVALGDSLTAGLGLPLPEAYPSRLQTLIDDAGYEYQVINAGVSGDTTAGGLRRLDWALDGDVRVLIVALGANDGLRGLSIDQMRTNLSAMIETAQAKDIDVLLAGMEALPNLGPEYTTAFRAVYPDLADRYGVRLIPFLLAGVAGEPALNQADGIHPNAEGARRVADLVWAALEPILAAEAAE